MRIYRNFVEGLSEITRDLAEMGIKVHTKTYQDKFVGDNPDFATMELQNYMYTVTNPRLQDLRPIQPWADREALERFSGEPLNPGTAWELRPDVWKQFLEEDGKFSYAYPERINTLNQIDHIVEAIKRDKLSRQLFLSIWNPSDILKLGGANRVPCSLGYLFQVRGGKLNMTYLMRSSDFFTHFQNDIYLAYSLQCLVADRAGIPTGNFTHWMGSLHVFHKDVEEVF